MSTCISIKDYIAMLNVYLDCDNTISIAEAESECFNDVSLICISVLLQRLRIASNNRDWLKTLTVVSGKYDSPSSNININKTIGTRCFEDDLVYCKKRKQRINTKLYAGIGAIIDKVLGVAEQTYGKNNVASFSKKCKFLYNSIVGDFVDYEWGSDSDFGLIETYVSYYEDSNYLSFNNIVILKMMHLLLDSMTCNIGSGKTNYIFDSDVVVSTLAEKDMLLLIRRWLRLVKNHDRWSFISDTSTKNFTISQRSDKRRKIVDCLVKVINPTTKKSYFTLILDSKTNHIHEKNYDSVMNANINQLCYYHAKYTASHPDVNIYSFLFYTIFSDCDVVRHLSVDEDSIRGSDTELVFASDTLTDVYKYGSLWSYHTEDEPITVHMYNTIDMLLTRLFQMNGVALRQKSAKRRIS